MDKNKIFDFVFSDNFEIFANDVERIGLGSIMLNLQSLGLEGNSKRDLDAGDVVDHIIDRQYAPYYFFVKKGSKWMLLYLWGGNKGNYDERETSRKAMQSNSEWFFTILKQVVGKGVVVDVRKKRGQSFYHVKKVGDIKDKLSRYINNPDSAYHTEGTGVFIRVKVTSSRINLYEVYQKDWPEVRRYLNELKIDYKTINMDNL